MTASAPRSARPAAPSDGPRDACGVFAVFAPSEHAAKLAYYGLYALQHRGQESAGIAVSDGKSIFVTKEMGLVNQVFDETRLTALEGHLGIGHVRYSTTGSSTWDNAQPTFRSTPGGHVISLGHNGNLTNTGALSAQLPGGDKCSSDSDLLSALLAEALGEEGIDGTADALAAVLPRVDGAFSLVVMDESTIYGARDPHGVRPLVIGRLKTGGWVIASETAALDIVGAHRVRDVEPGEIVSIDSTGLRSRRYADARPKACLFEYVYVARPDHQTAETSVYAARRRMGELLSREAPVDADLVIPVPDSGMAAAGGYSAATGIPYAEGLTKNRYVGRTFIQPTQSLRQLGIRLKLNPLPDIIEGQRLIVVDDSIVRGNTSRQLVAMLRSAGAAEVHLRITAPPIKWPCFYGIDMASRAELIGAGMDVGQIRDFLDADSLAYLSLEALVETTKRPHASLCRACFDGEYPIPVEALQKAHGKGVMATLWSEGMTPPEQAARQTYAGAGVDLVAADDVVERIKPHVERTHRPGVLDRTIGGFGGLFAIDTDRWRRPVMVTATDGVGTKLEIARRLGRHDTVGIDLVAMVVDDIVVSGAEPQVFLDYIAIGRLDPDVVTDIVAGIAEGCVQAGCALVGGETAEHPGVMPATDYDLAGFAVGLVEQDEVLGPHRVSQGDVLVGMRASGLHSNGYSLVRRLVEGLDLTQAHGLDLPLGEALLTPTTIYTKPCLALAERGLVQALCHVTGGGLPGNLPRVLPADLGADVDTQTWDPGALFSLMARLGDVEAAEMFRVFNMGVGMVAVVRPDDVEPALSLLGEHGVTAWTMGTVTGPAGVRLH